MKSNISHGGKICFLNTEATTMWSDQVDMFQRALDTLEVSWDVFDVFAHRFPDEIHIYRGAVICGSSDNLSPNPPSYSAQLFALIRQCENIPQFRLLGVCYGAQAIAMALGGVISQCASPVCGIASLEFTADMYFLVNRLGVAATPCSIISTHSQCITCLPRDSILLAKSAYTPNECFLVGRYRNLLGLQSHPEYTSEIVMSRLGCRADGDADCMIAFVRAFFDESIATQQALRDV